MIFLIQDATQRWIWDFGSYLTLFSFSNAYIYTAIIYLYFIQGIYFIDIKLK